MWCSSQLIGESHEQWRYNDEFSVHDLDSHSSTTRGHIYPDTVGPASGFGAKEALTSIPGVVQRQLATHAGSRIGPFGQGAKHSTTGEVVDATGKR